MNDAIQKQIQKHLEQIISCITETLDTESIILLGSAARDELSIRAISSDKIELFSDYECLVVVRKRPSSIQRYTLQTKLNRLEKNINNPNPLFHIDIIIREEKRLESLPPIIFTYEMKANGRVLYGRDIFPQVPTVTLKNLDLQNTNEILYKRLWALLLYLPETFVTGQQMNMSEKRVTNYILCRNSLDITTVLLPHEGILLPTYQQRVTKLRDIYNTLNLAHTYGPDFPNTMQKCFNFRLSLQFDELDLPLWYSETIANLARALRQIGFKLDSTSTSKIYNEWPISRGEWYNLARMTQQYTRSYGIQKAVKWLRTSKKQELTAGLLRMHQALIAWQKGDAATAVNHLLQSQQILNTFLFTKTTIPQTSFAQQWFALRQQWAEFWRIYIRLNDPKFIERFTKIITWQYQ